jgi:UDP-sugar pyrophosphorylase
MHGRCVAGDAVVAAGDVNDASGFSPFPGNINQLVVKLDTYVKTLASSGGVIGEFVNPKFKDAARTAFKKPTRLECMMQDFPKSLPPSAAVGFTTMSEARPRTTHEAHA